jgi:predicted RNase H-like nuclease (RuvC/YqgF family)
LKCTAEFELLSEPDDYEEWFIYQNKLAISKESKILCQQYKDAMTFRERITQLTKENQELKETKDNLKETLIKEVERSLRRLDINIKLEKQLQAAEDRIKE